MRFSIHIFLLFTIMFSQENSFTGKYHMRFEQEYNDQNCTIRFEGNTYVRELQSGRKITGKVRATKFVFFLVDDVGGLEMGVNKADIKKDTIMFGTKKQSQNGSNFVLMSGKLYR